MQLLFSWIINNCRFLFFLTNFVLHFFYIGANLIKNLTLLN